MKSRDEMITELQSGVCLIKFEKIDGTKRIMYATLDPSAIPDEKKPKQSSNNGTSAVRVFDIESFEWKSYRVDSVELFEKMGNNMSTHAIETIMEHGGTRG